MGKCLWTGNVLFQNFFGLPRRLVISGESDRSDRGTMRFLLFGVVWFRWRKTRGGEAFDSFSSTDILCFFGCFALRDNRIVGTEASESADSSDLSESVSWKLDSGVSFSSSGDSRSVTSTSWSSGSLLNKVWLESSTTSSSLAFSRFFFSFSSAVQRGQQNL